MSLIESDLPQRVEDGAALLDDWMNHWWQKIDTRTLALGSSCSCILGQLIGSYRLGLNQLGFEPDSRAARLWAGDNGFTLRSEECLSAYRWHDLTQAWLREIEQRRYTE